MKSSKQLQEEILALHRVLKSRNKTLANAIVLLLRYRNLIGTSRELLKPRKFQPKRGKKPEGIPIKEAMYILKVSHRTAQDYVRFFRVLDLIEQLSLTVIGKLGEKHVQETIRKLEE